MTVLLFVAIACQLVTVFATMGAVSKDDSGDVLAGMIALVVVIMPVIYFILTLFGVGEN